MAVDDRSIKIPVELDDKQAQKELNRLENSIRKAHDAIARKNIKKDGITAQLEEATKKADILQAKLTELKTARASVSERRNSISNELTEAATAADAAKAKIASLKAELAPFEAQEAEAHNRMMASLERLREARASGKWYSPQIKENAQRAAEAYRQAAEANSAAQARILPQIEEQERAFERATNNARALKTELAGLKSEDSYAEPIKETEAALKEATAEVKRRQTEEARVNQQILEEEANIRRMTGQYNTVNAQLQQQGASVWPQLRQQAGVAMAGVSTAISKSMKTMLKYGLGIRSVYILFRKLRTALIDGIKQFAQYDEETRNNLNNLKSALSGLKGSFAAAFAPIVNAVVPYLVTFINWIAKAIDAVSMFFAILGGKSTYKRAVSNISAVGAATSGAADAAAEAEKNFSGLDELNIFQEDNGSGGGGGGGVGGSGGGLSWEDVPVDTDSFTGRLALTFQDVFLDWTDLTGEQIAEKIITGLIGLMGGVTGFLLTGSLAGGLVGSILGMALGLVASTMIFDHDGEISQDEILRMLALAATALAGGFLGFVVSGNSIKGALVGASIGVGLFAAVSAQFGEEGMLTRDQALTMIAGSLGVLAGGAIGFLVSGGNIVGALAGAVAGAVIGVGISANFTTEGETFWSGYNSPIDWFMSQVLGLPSDQELETKLNNAKTLAILKVTAFFKNIQEDIDEWSTNNSLAKWFQSWADIDENGGWDIETQLSNWWTLIKAWFSDYFVRGLAQIGIDATNALVEPIENGINSAIDKLNEFIRNHPKFADFFGLEELPHIELTLVPDLDPPVGTYYKQTKEQIEAESKKNPTGIDSTANLTGWSPSFSTDPWVYADTYGNKFFRWFGSSGGTNFPWVYADTYGNKFFRWFNSSNYPYVYSDVYGKWWKNKLGYTPYVDTDTYGKWWKNKLGYTPYVDTDTYGRWWYNSLGYTPGIDADTYGKWWYPAFKSTPWVDSGANLIDYYRAWSGAPWVNVSANVAAIGGSIITTGYTARWRQFADGGVISKGFWNALPKYGGGTRNAHGSLFVAGEAGPEVLGHIGGRTEVLNRSQLASTMYAAITSGMAQALSKLKFKVDSSDLIQVVHAAKESIERMRTSVEHIAYVLSTPNLALAGPAVATGTVIPPMLINISEDLEGIKEAVDRLTARIDNLSTDKGDINVSAQVRERVLFDMTIAQGRAVKAQTGVNPFDI